MKKLIILSVLLIGCGPEHSDSEKFDRTMSDLSCPVIIIGISKASNEYPCVVVRDGRGAVRTFGENHTTYSSQFLPKSISDSRKVGDTLKPCK